MSSESEGFGPTRGSNFHLTFKSRPFVPANPAAAVNSPCPSRRLCDNPGTSQGQAAGILFYLRSKPPYFVGYHVWENHPPGTCNLYVIKVPF